MANCRYVGRSGTEFRSTRVVGMYGSALMNVFLDPSWLCHVLNKRSKSWSLNVSSLKGLRHLVGTLEHPTFIKLMGVELGEDGVYR